MNIYCHVCKKEMEIMQDLISEISVFPCGCAATDLQALTARAEQAEAERDAWRDAFFALEFDPITGECLLGCGGDSAEGHNDDCVFIANLPDPKLAPSTGRKERDELKATVYAFFANLPNSAIEEAREVWGNTNTRIILEARQAVIDKLKGGKV